MKRLLCIIILAAVLALCAGCGSDPSRGGSDSGDAVTTDGGSGLSLPDGAVCEIDCPGIEGAAIGIVPAGGARFAVVTCPYSLWTEDGEKHEDDPQKVYIVDAEENGVVSQSELPNGIQLLGVRENGDFVVFDPVGGKLSVIDSDGKTTGKYDLDLSDPAYDRRTDSITDVSHSCIFKIDLAAGESEELFSAPWSAGIVAFDPVGMTAAVRTTAANDGSGYSMGLIPLSGGENVSLPFSDYVSCGFIDGAFVCSDFRGEYDENGDLVSSDCGVYVTDTQTGAVDYYKLPRDFFFNYNGASRYLLGTSYPNAGDGSDSVNIYRLFDLTSARATADIAELKGAYNVVSGYLEDCKRYAAAVNRDPSVDGISGEYGTKLYLIDPELADYSEALEEAAIPDENATVEEVALSDDFADQRAHADSIEEKYGVRILLGNEVLGAAPNGNYDRVSFEEFTEDELTFTGREELVRYRAEEVDRALDHIDSTLSVYPDGFFDRFVNGYGEGGLRIIIVDRLDNPSGSFVADGYAYTHGAWYCVDIKLDRLCAGDACLHHEIWHTIEDRITDEYPESFNMDDWAKFNPEGFEYLYDYNDYQLRDDTAEYRLLDGCFESPDDVYFIYSYSTVGANEDRATLIETLMDENYDPEEHDGVATAYEWLTRYPHLKSKLEYMERNTEKVFGGVYWKP